MAQDYAKKIKALRAKANHKNTPPEEAQALLAKVAELMMRHSIDEAALREERGDAPEEVTVATLDLPKEHGTVLMDAVYPMILAMGGEAIVIKDVFTMVGTPSLLENLTTLFISLNNQMVTAANKAGDVHEAKLRKEHPRWSDDLINDKVDQFVWDYVRGYGKGVADKIRARRGEVINEAPGNALVLQTEEERIKAAFDLMYPHRKSMRGEALRNFDAIEAGRRAGRNADIGDTRVANNATRAIGG
ncbi:DUF2786 domain-containing protein [Actinoallomurus sp. NPDC052274]|uniref:DUF2786 domain-containing protein n=1 Tax=Actinoallomurus sp. NPDC052274 TaxID=3155420 RepID=UPI003429BFAC